MREDILHNIEKFVAERVKKHDVSHDIWHIKRVVKNALEIQSVEGGDLEILYPAAYMHDLVVYPKNDPRNKEATDESAQIAAEFLSKQSHYPKHKIPQVKTCIKECSFTKDITPDTLEGKILRDADMLEATGAVSIARTFASTALMHRIFFHPDDPFCEYRKPEPHEYALDIFYSRLLVVKDKMFTTTGRKLAENKTHFLESFLRQLRSEI